MGSSSRSKSVALISSVFFVIGLLSMNIDGFGLAPIFVVLISFFMLIIHSFLHFSCRKNSDVFNAYEESAKTKAAALESGLNNKNK
ncbi:hypothetical protein ACED25_22350 [Vibrio sp. 1F263]|uniref:hypothetical protein n=1 Tax=Vibrio sp. 1F263 TaxID=3230012 RepID=UPI00352E8BD0